MPELNKSSTSIYRLRLLTSIRLSPSIAALAAYCRNRVRRLPAEVKENIRSLLLNQRIPVPAAFGRKRALNGGMLRITLQTASHSGLFILEGRLTDEWVKEFLRVARGANQGIANIVDLEEVFYVDSEGEKALQLLARRGARFITESAYGKGLCNRLKLKRVRTSNLDSNDGKGPDGSRRLRESRTAHAGRLDALTAADANQHSRRHAE